MAAVIRKDEGTVDGEGDGDAGRQAGNMHSCTVAQWKLANVIKSRIRNAKLMAAG